MSKKDFERLLDQQKNESALDWTGIGEEWVSRIHQLYELVSDWLDEYRSQGTVEIATYDVDITEESLGTYQVPAMDIVVGNKKARLVPVGAIIIGASGRVDLRGPAGTSTFVLVPMSSSEPRIYSFISTSEEERKKTQAEIDAALEKTKKEPRTWKVATEPPNVKYLDLDEEMFFDVLVEVFGGAPAF